MLMALSPVRICQIVVLLLSVLSSAAHAQWTTAQVTAPRVQYRTFQSIAAGTAVSFHIYTPPAYDLQPLRRFPVLYWLHGSGSATTGIAPMSNWFATAMAQGLLPPMVIVFPNGMPFGMYCDAADGSTPIETVIIDELIPHVDANFRTIASRSGRVLEGFSMGGYGTGRLGTKYSELFCGISLLAPGPMQLDFPNAPIDAPVPPDRRAMIFADVWNNDPSLMIASNPSTLASSNAPMLRSNDLLIRIAIGEADSVLPPGIEFHNLLTSLGITHSFHIYPGIGHQTIPLLAAIGPSNWSFYRDALSPRCDSLDFNNDTITPDSADLDDFLAVLSGGPGACSTFPAPGCNDLDFNNDAIFPDSADLDAFIRRLGGGPCAE
jgi:enterochelin esterase-like enzyme